MAGKYAATSPLPLQGACNVRELGGYPIGAGGYVQPRRFLRGDGLYRLSEQDKAMLYAYGVRAVVDLRSGLETKRCVCAMAGYRDVEYHHFPLLDNLHSASFQQAFPDTMSELYISLLTNCREQLCAVFHCFARLSAPENLCKGVLFHCTAGKDRTGVVAMLLLDLIGVDEEVIVLDYAASGEYTAKLRPDNVKGLVIPPHVLQADPEEMRCTLRHLRAQYGSAEGFLLSGGVAADEIARIRVKLMDAQEASDV